MAGCDVRFRTRLPNEELHLISTGRPTWVRRQNQPAGLEQPLHMWAIAQSDPEGISQCFTTWFTTPTRTSRKRSCPSHRPRPPSRPRHILLMGSLLGLAALAITPGTSAQEHDCQPYEPTLAGEVFDGPTINWAQQFERDTYEFTVPDDPGGGYVIARAETFAPTRPHMRIIPPSGQGVVTQVAPTSPVSLSPQVLEVAFEVDADTTFTVELFEDNVSSAGSFPVFYEWSWTFISRVDCYEENDSRPLSWPDPIATSRTVPFDQVHEAFSLAGHQTFSISVVDDNNYDWYDFTINEPTEISIGTLDVPADQSIRLRLFRRGRSHEAGRRSGSWRQRPDRPQRPPAGDLLLRAPPRSPRQPGGGAERGRTDSGPLRRALPVPRQQPRPLLAKSNTRLCSR